MKPKVYIESTIPSYLTAWPSRDLVVAAHQQVTKEWWERRRNEFDIFISQFVLDEIGGGDKVVAEQRLAIVDGFPLLDITDEVTTLAALFMKKRILSKKAATDAIHIALATVHEMSFLMTWNCAHIANAFIKKKIETVCSGHGFECPVICTPEELLEG